MAEYELLIENVDDRSFLCGLLDVMYDELSAPKQKSKGRDIANKMECSGEVL